MDMQTKAKQEECTLPLLCFACARPSSWRRRCSLQSPRALPDLGHSLLRRWASSPPRKARGPPGTETRQRTLHSPMTPTTRPGRPPRLPLPMAWEDTSRLCPTLPRCPAHTPPRTQDTLLPPPLLVLPLTPALSPPTLLLRLRSSPMPPPSPQAPLLLPPLTQNPSPLKTSSSLLTSTT